MRMRCLLGLWLAAMLCISSLGAAVNDAPLADAVERRDNQAVLSLLKKRADVNAAQSDGATALHWAAYLDDAETALVWAAAAGHGPVVQVLIAHRADIRARSNSGATPLLFAVRRGDMAAVRALVAAGADVKAARPDGATPLLVAVINGHEDLVDFFLDKGADPNVEGGSTELTVQGVRARPMELKYRKLTNNERDSEGVSRGNIFGKPLQAAVHVANCHIRDQVIE